MFWSVIWHSCFGQIFGQIVGQVFGPDLLGPENTVCTSTGAERCSIQFYPDRENKLFTIGPLEIQKRTGLYARYSIMPCNIPVSSLFFGQICGQIFDQISDQARLLTWIFVSENTLYCAAGTKKNKTEHKTS